MLELLELLELELLELDELLAGVDGAELPPLLQDTIKSMHNAAITLLTTPRQVDVAQGPEVLQMRGIVKTL